MLNQATNSCRAFFCLAGVILMLSVTACSEEAAGPPPASAPGSATPAVLSAAAESATPEAAPTPEPAPGTPIAFENFPLDAQKTLEHRGYATIEWPGHPDWSYISANGPMLQMAAHGPQSPEQTHLRLMLQPAQYRVKADAKLRDTSQSSVLLSGTVAGSATPLFEQTFKAGETVALDQTFTIEGDAPRELRLELRLAPDAENRQGNHGAYGATLFLGKFQIEKVS